MCRRSAQRWLPSGKRAYFLSTAVAATNHPGKGGVITIGTFDGVHLGHQAILREVGRVATRLGVPATVITFDPHPRKFLFPDEPLPILTPLPEKVALIRALGIDEVFVQPFDQAFSTLSAEDYIHDFLVGRFAPACIVIGHDHQFGRGRDGNVEVLRQFAPSCGYEVCRLDAALINDAAVSSTKTRNALLGGDVALAKNLLGRPYQIAGMVASGAQLGRTIGFPTANLQPGHPDQLIPAIGVYAGFAHTHDGGQYPAMINIGRRPTVASNGAVTIEAHLIGFSGDLYGQPFILSFEARLREEQKFAGVAALKEQLELDRQAAVRALA